MPTDIESLAKELRECYVESGVGIGVGQWPDVARHVLRLCAAAELRGLVAVRERLNRTCLMPVTSDVMGVCDALIAAHHAKWEKPHEHAATRKPDNDTEVCSCGFVRTHAWTEWRQSN